MKFRVCELLVGLTATLAPLCVNQAIGQTNWTPLVVCNDHLNSGSLVVDQDLNQNGKFQATIVGKGAINYLLSKRAQKGRANYKLYDLKSKLVISNGHRAETAIRDHVEGYLFFGFEGADGILNIGNGNDTLNATKWHLVIPGLNSANYFKDATDWMFTNCHFFTN